MGQLQEQAKVVYADGPASKPSQPPKAGAIGLFGMTESLLATAINGAIIGNSVVYATRALLFANLGFPANTLGIVYNDSTIAYNGIYVKNGSSGSGSWSLTGLSVPSSFVTTLTALLTDETTEREAFDAQEAAARIAADLSEYAGRITADETLRAQIDELTEAVSEYASQESVDQALAVVDQIGEVAAAAEAARDAAAGYASDIVYASSVPIFSSKNGMAGLSLPAGMNQILIGSRSALGDSAPCTSWIRVDAEPDVPAALKFRTTDRFLTTGATSAANGGWWLINEARPLLDIFKSGFTPQRRLDHIQARMAAGETVKVACFGDSTTDGQATSGWTKNPVDGSNNAVGNIDHEATAPNAWPSKLKALLRAMHGNVNISVWNAGYTGQRLDNGWAYANYETAVINNPAYGVPDVVFIAFGLNDIVGAGSQVAVTIEQTRSLCLKVMAYGSVPILMTCDPMWRNDPAARDHKEASRQLDAAKLALAEELGIPMLDIATDIRNWLSRNKDGIGWRNIQPDALHFGDIGHAFKAGAVAKALFKDIVRVAPGEFRRINTFDSATAYLGDYSSRIYTGAHLAQGGNQSFTASNIPAAGTALQEIWIWNDGSDIELIYRGLDNEQFLIAGTTDAPKVSHTNTITGVETTRVPAGVGFVSPSNTYRNSDIPYRFGHLPFGLSRVRYLAPNYTNNYLGNFELWPSQRSEVNNCLKNTGPFQQYFVQSADAYQAKFAPPFTDGSNAFGLFAGDYVFIFADLTLPVGTGFIFAHNQAWGTSGGNVDGDHAFTMVYRNSDTQLSVYVGREEAGVLAFAAGIGTATIPSGDDLKIRLRLRRNGDQQELDIYNGWTSDVSLLKVTRDLSVYPMNWGGIVGGLFYNNAEAAATKTAIIKECWTKRFR